jgi:hypothetical protein
MGYCNNRYATLKKPFESVFCKSYGTGGATDKKEKIREALKNAIDPGRTRAGSNVETLVDIVEIKRSAVAYFVLKMSV